jgi:hypothetical protein
VPGKDHTSATSGSQCVASRRPQAPCCRDYPAARTMATSVPGSRKGMAFRCDRRWDGWPGGGGKGACADERTVDAQAPLAESAAPVPGPLAGSVRRAGTGRAFQHQPPTGTSHRPAPAVARHRPSAGTSRRPARPVHLISSAMSHHPQQARAVGLPIRCGCLVHAARATWQGHPRRMNTAVPAGDTRPGMARRRSRPGSCRQAGLLPGRPGSCRARAAGPRNPVTAKTGRGIRSPNAGCRPRPGRGAGRDRRACRTAAARPAGLRG